MDEAVYMEFIRSRITQLRIERNISEHKMSLDLDKSGSYIRGISSGASMPSVKELMHIISYFQMNPAEFFAPLADNDSPYSKLCARLRGADTTTLAKVEKFLDLIE